MKSFLLLLPWLFVTSLLQAADINYKELEQSFFDNYANDQTFVDKTGLTFKVVNTKTHKGLYVETNEGWLKHGVHYRYQNNGLLVSMTTYDRNIKNGPFKQYHYDGSIMFKYNYLNNKCHGLLLQYRDKTANKTLFNKRMYYHGLKQGIAYRYDKKGRLSHIYHYEKDRRHGEVITYNPETGEVMSKQIYHHGALQPSGKPLSPPY